MRWMCATLVALASATAVNGQILWAGLAAGTSWTWQAPTAPDQNLLHSHDGAPAGFVAIPVYRDTLVRFQVADLPFEPTYDGVGWPGKLRGYTVGVDTCSMVSWGSSSSPEASVTTTWTSRRNSRRRASRSGSSGGTSVSASGSSSPGAGA